MAQGSILDPAPPGGMADLGEDFGRRVLLTVDTEEEFDWNGPFTRDRHGLTHVPVIADFQQLCENLGALPVYLCDWPILNDSAATAIISDAVNRGAAEAGIQLHSWVTPPFEEELGARNSFAGNLPPELEAAKLNALCEAYENAFGKRPLAFRSGRYGLGPQSVAMLKKAGIRIDLSVRPLFDYSAEKGPDYSDHPVRPYWANADRSVLELPLTSVYGGIARQFGKSLRKASGAMPMVNSALSRLSLLERIPLTPEGVTSDEARTAIDLALDDGLSLLVMSLHSPSLAPGNTPYVRTAQDLETLQAWMRDIYAHLDRRGIRSTTTQAVFSAVNGQIEK
ncbi:polysaccharide deacetylase family protein [Erythrobacter sp. MTPC3]|uniref:polysaccharide deacetylase family protein n=1 Tax=Erythrobacter sp. MTPC3 TaxID=3056564 RepID=UPI0036F40BB5